MIQRLYQKCLVRPEDVKPWRDECEVVGTFNPGAIALGDQVVLRVRVAQRPRERRRGFSAVRSWDVRRGRVIVW